MTSKLLYPILLLITILQGIGLTSCSDDPKDPNEMDIFNYDIDDDLLLGKVIYTINLSDLTEGDYFLDTKEPVDFFTYGTSSIELKVEDRERIQCLTAKVVSGFKGDRLVFPAYAVGRLSGKIRNVIIIAENANSNEGAEINTEDDGDDSGDNNSISPLFPTYGNFLGKGTLCYEKLGNTTRDILLFDHLPLNNGNLFTYGNVNLTTVDEIHDTSFESVTKSWSFNVGLSGAAKGFSGGLSFGMHDMSKQSKDYEYFMSYLKVARTEMRLQTSELQKMATRDNKSAQNLLSYFATSFYEDLLETCTNSFNADNFYNTWGTDMIYQGTLGGECKFVFSREENTYQHTIGTDIKAYVQHEKEVEPNTKMGDWYNIFMQKSNSPDFKTTFDFSWQKEEYRKASHSELKIEALGGNASTDPKEWLKAFQNDDEYSKWSIVSYLTSRDEKTRDSWYLYNIDLIANDLINAVEYVFKQTGNMSYEDRMMIENARKNIAKLSTGRAAFINRHKVVEADKTPLIIADFKMVRGKKRASGNPKPFTAPNPTNSSQYLTYYPMIANENLDIKAGKHNMRGKPLDTNDHVFVAAARYSSHFWYYALAHASDDCPGLTAIELLSKDEAHKDKYRDYHRHGDEVRTGLGGLRVSERYVYVKYFDKDDSSDKPDKRITAVGFYDLHKNYDKHPSYMRVVASTGGTEWLPNYTGSQRQKYYENFWKNAIQNFNIKTFLSDNQLYQGGWAVTPHKIKLIYTTDTLPISDLKDLPKVQLPTW